MSLLLLCILICCAITVGALPNPMLPRREIVVERINLKYVNTKYMDANMTASKVSRNDLGINVFFNLFEDNILNSSIISVQLYSLHNNEYRLAPAKLERNVCGFFATEWQTVCHDVQKYGNLKCDCPMQKGLYYLKNYIIDTSSAPASPWNNIKLDITTDYKNMTVMHLEAYVKFDQDAKLVNQFLPKL